ncbi:hypothetical protein Ppb6_02541 [Photorhabdus australis subsp. thailandensis]|uniref:Uncharacterized protein n=1 Tax=Photorhabdus australis subsp. thailandensis TaxID=2805096 RepID=A0A1C0U3G9_9GAMM|nr:hypothetical protein Ppb6_02541 [Photorhabdus australis subsp. thailandensis]
MNFKMLESSDIKTFKFNNIIVFQTCTLKCLEYIPEFLFMLDVVYLFPSAGVFVFLPPDNKKKGNNNFLRIYR